MLCTQQGSLLPCLYLVVEPTTGHSKKLMRHLNLGNLMDVQDGNEEEKNTDEKDKEKQTKIKRKLGPRIVLNPQRLVGSRGIGAIEPFFSDIPEKLRGKGKENEDLNLVMGRLQHWAHRLMPSLQFDDCLKKIESLGNKKEVVISATRENTMSKEIPKNFNKPESSSSTQKVKKKCKYAPYTD
ncbi:hypothetical protein J6590_007749 [Homalodisca vitripennis]|nr:hypothetical protein J6590_007749 [Homalodisca vitripennis]